MHRKGITFVLAVGMTATMLSRGAWARPIDFDAGHWRLELQGAGALHSGKTDHEGDYFITGSVEYESPWTDHVALGIRAYPLFVYPKPQPLYGVALGLVLRIYRNPEKDSGPYAEAGVAALWHSQYFSDNSSRLNFLDELGVGYKFEGRPWHIAVKYQHISNAGIARENAGVNAVSVGFGYSF